MRLTKEVLAPFSAGVVPEDEPAGFRVFPRRVNTAGTVRIFRPLLYR